jgi:hypothetical protein
MPALWGFGRRRACAAGGPCARRARCAGHADGGLARYGGDPRTAGGGWAGHLGPGGVLPRLVVHADAACGFVRADVGSPFLLRRGVASPGRLLELGRPLDSQSTRKIGGGAWCAVGSGAGLWPGVCWPGALAAGRPVGVSARRAPLAGGGGSSAGGGDRSPAGGGGVGHRGWWCGPRWVIRAGRSPRLRVWEAGCPEGTPFGGAGSRRWVGGYCRCRRAAGAGLPARTFKASFLLAWPGSWSWLAC